MPRIFPPVYMLVFALCMWLLARYFPVMIFSGFNYLALMLIGIGLLIDLWSLFLFFRAKTTFHPLKLNNTSSLVVTGMYKFTRNPMYLGMLFLLSGWFFYLGAFSPLALLPLFIWWITKVQIKPEEKVLAEKFLAEYENYRNSVRRWT